MISYENIHQSISFYRSRGYSRIEAPWTIVRSYADGEDGYAIGPDAEKLLS